MRIPQTQSARKTCTSKDPLSKLLSDATIQNQTTTCPCESQVMSWCNITTFFVYVGSKVPSNSEEVATLMNFTKDEGKNQLGYLCNTSQLWVRQICHHILSPVMDDSDSRTYLPTANAFARPELLFMEIANRIDTNVYEQANTYTLFGYLNDTKLYNYSESLTYLLRDMSTQFRSNSHSSQHDFWKASQETRYTYDRDIGFGMNVSWDTYLEKCNARFCDVELRVSGINQALRAMGQVGGITTVISLALKFLIWPALRIALRFPTSK
eukprot:c24155_g2_i3 orf=84-884(-)